MRFCRPQVFLSGLLVLTGLCSNIASAQMSMLHANGRSIVNAQGQVVPLVGSRHWIRASVWRRNRA